MHSVRSPPGLLTLVLAAIAAASPYPRDSLRDIGFGYLKNDQCSEYCGVDNELCCSNDEACYTSSGVASCTTAPALDKRDDYLTTSTWTVTYTSVISSWYVPTTTAGTGTNGEDCIPPDGSGEIACGNICCATWQYCAYEGQCIANEGYSTWTEITTTGVMVTTQYSAPWRPTSGVATATTTTDTTGTYLSETTTPTSTSMGNGTAASTSPSLSPGAIAGIVVGALAGVVLLLLLCFCCIVRGLWGVVAGILGFGKKKKRDSERVEIIEERYSRHGSQAAAARPSHRNWFGGGGGGGRPSAAGSRKEKKSGGGLGWIAAGAGAAALLLGLRRHDKHKKGASSHRSRSDWSSSYYTDSYTATSPSSLSSDRRTRRSARTGRSRHSGQSRHSRGTRASRASRPSRV